MLPIGNVVMTSHGVAVYDRSPRPLVYLAGPYSHPDPEVCLQRFNAINSAAIKLIGQGHSVFSPISMSRPLELAGMKGDWETWKRLDTDFISCCHTLYVLCLPGWDMSVGVRAEIALATQQGLTIEYLKP